MKIQQVKKISLAGGFLVLIIFGLLFITGRRSLAQESDQISVENSAGGSVETGDQILALLQELTIIRLDDSIFTNPMFLSLNDYHVDLSDEPKQRNNPFAPIGQDAVLEESSGSAMSAPTGTSSVSSKKGS